MHTSRMMNVFCGLFAAFWPWQTVWLWREVFVDDQKWQYGTVGIYLSTVSLFVLTLSGAWLARRRIVRDWREKFSPHRPQVSEIPFWTGLIFVGYLFFLSFRAEDQFLSFFKTASVALLLSSVYVTSFFRLNLRKILVVSTVSLTIGALIGLWQFLTQSSFGSSWLGISALEIWRGGTSVIVADGRWLRAYGAQTHPNIFGALSVMGMLAAIALAVVSRQQRRIFLIFCAIVLGAGAMSSFSRSALAGGALVLLFLGGYLAFFARDLKVEKISSGKIFLATVLALSITAGIFHFCFQPLYVERVQINNRWERNSLTERVDQVSEAWQIIRQEPFLGIGPGNYTLILRLSNGNEFPVWRYQPVHNVWLLLWAEIGAVGLILTIILVFSFFCAALRRFENFYRSEEKFLFVFLTGLAGFLFFVSWFDHWLWTSQAGLMLTAWWAISVGQIDPNSENENSL